MRLSRLINLFRCDSPYPGPLTLDGFANSLDQITVQYLWIMDCHVIHDVQCLILMIIFTYCTHLCSKPDPHERERGSGCDYIYAGG